jgi:hypothetical protein
VVNRRRWQRAGESIGRDHLARHDLHPDVEVIDAAMMDARLMRERSRVDRLLLLDLRKPRSDLAIGRSHERLEAPDPTLDGSLERELPFEAFEAHVRAHEAIRMRAGITLERGDARVLAAGCGCPKGQEKPSHDDDCTYQEKDEINQGTLLCGTMLMTMTARQTSIWSHGTAHP